MRREVQHVRPKQIAEELDECGGPAAPGLRIGLDELRARGGREDLGDADPEIFAAQLPTFAAGRAEALCTADYKQKGLSWKVTGQRDVGACNGSYMSRVERAAAARIGGT